MSLTTEAQYVVIYTDCYGRRSHGVATNPFLTLAELVYDGWIAGADRGRRIKEACVSRILPPLEDSTPAREWILWYLWRMGFAAAFGAIGAVYARTHGGEDDDHETYGG